MDSDHSLRPTLMETTGSAIQLLLWKVELKLLKNIRSQICSNEQVEEKSQSEEFSNRQAIVMTGIYTKDPFFVLFCFCSTYQKNQIAIPKRQHNSNTVEIKITILTSVLRDVQMNK
jgi:hypothetical protein